MNKKMVFRNVVLAFLVFATAGCKMLFGPDKTGEFRLSSEKSGTEVYYLYGYSYEKSEFYRYPYDKDPVPDIINEGYRMIGEGGQYELPGFNIPAQVNGFALVGEFETLAEARAFYDGYKKVEENLQFVTISDIVEPFQVWIQKTSKDNYVKLLVLETASLEGDQGNKYSEALLEYTYQPNGSTDFPD